ncbi:hypothetical protein T484DRAFT_1855051 [Baffinella frigidus]|nr:hypothetical protein T484DRAFT_1855051 [Cryptophyta sp. CCMP2293]
MGLIPAWMDSTCGDFPPISDWESVDSPTAGSASPTAGSASPTAGAASPTTGSALPVGLLYWDPAQGRDDDTNGGGAPSSTSDVTEHMNLFKSGFDAANAAKASVPKGTIAGQWARHQSDMANRKYNREIAILPGPEASSDRYAVCDFNMAGVTSAWDGVEDFPLRNFSCIPIADRTHGIVQHHLRIAVTSLRSANPQFISSIQPSSHIFLAAIRAGGGDFKIFHTSMQMYTQHYMQMVPDINERSFYSESDSTNPRVATIEGYHLYIAYVLVFLQAFKDVTTNPVGWGVVACDTVRANLVSLVGTAGVEALMLL